MEKTRTVIDDFGFEWRIMRKTPKTQLHWYLQVTTLVNDIPDGGFIRKSEEARQNLDKLAKLKAELIEARKTERSEILANQEPPSWRQGV